MLAGVVSALFLAAWYFGGRKPLEGGELGAVAVFVAIACVGGIPRKVRDFNRTAPSSL